MERALPHFASLGVPVGRILADNGGTYRSTVFGTTVAAHGIRHKWTRTLPSPDERQGASERVGLRARHTSNEARLSALPEFLDR